MNDTQLKLFAERLNKLRQKRQLTQQQLGDVLQIPRVSIARYETAERTPTVDHLVQFAQFFKVPTDYLLGLSSVESYDTELQAVCNYTGLSAEAIITLNVELSHTKLGYITLPLEGREIPINITLEMAELANQFITGDYFIALLQTVIYLKKNSVEWVEECKKGVRSNGGNFCGNEKTRILSKECDFAILDCNQTIENFVRKYDNRYNKPEFEQKTEHKAINYIKNEILAEMKAEQNGEHNPPKE
ncbi:MAG: helix-turn-helix domain-containing protein [Oscillospiraceae bacterium]|nr:helix-turn-helix domain-containing protein [Oscillospiraceae bacterium]